MIVSPTDPSCGRRGGSCVCQDVAECSRTDLPGSGNSGDIAEVLLFLNETGSWTSDKVWEQDPRAAKAAAIISALRAPTGPNCGGADELICRLEMFADHGAPNMQQAQETISDALLEIRRLQRKRPAPLPSTPALEGGAVAFINTRLEDLAEANALYGKDRRLGAPDKIARNDREISWLKDLRSMIHASPQSAVLDRETVIRVISDHTCAGYADDKVLGIDQAADAILALSPDGLVKGEREAAIDALEFIANVQEPFLESTAYLMWRKAREALSLSRSHCQSPGEK